MNPILIVGQGIAGTVLAHSLEQRGVPFLVVDNGHKNCSSLAAAGLYNPLILKRGRLTWRAHDFVKTCEAFYTKVEKSLKAEFLHPTAIHRRIHNTEEYNEWAARIEKKNLSEFLIGYVKAESFPSSMDLPFDTFQVKGGWLDVNTLLSSSLEHFQSINSFQQADLELDSIEEKEGHWVWNGKEFSQVVLCTGYQSMHDKTFFKELPFTPAKGHTMDVRIPGLGLERILNAAVFIIPLGEDMYRIGSTYSWSDFNEQVEPSEIEKLRFELEKICSLDYEILHTKAGVRPAVKDRRPLIGECVDRKGVWHFGGFGSRAVLTCPKLATEFLASLLDGAALSDETRISRTD